MASLSESSVDKLVLDYLKRRNFKEAGRVLELELDVARARGAADDAAPSWAEAGDVELPEGVAAATAGSGDPEALARSFDALASWADSVLVEYRPELSALLYPALASTYLALVGMRCKTAALELLDRHQARFADARAAAAAAGGHAGRGDAAHHAHGHAAANGPRAPATGFARSPGPALAELARLRGEELRELRAITSPEQLRASRVAARLRAAKTRVPLTTYASEMLGRFLKAPSVAPLLGVVSERIEVVVVDGSPPGLADVAAREAAAAAAAAAAGAGAPAVDAVDASVGPDGALKGGLEPGIGGAAAAGGLAAGAAGAAQTLPGAARTIDLRLLANSVEDAWATERAEAREREAARRAAAEGEGASKRRRAALQRAVAEAKAAREALGAERMAKSSLPLPPEPDAVRAARRRALAKRWSPSTGPAGGEGGATGPEGADDEQGGRDADAPGAGADADAAGRAKAPSAPGAAGADRGSRSIRHLPTALFATLVNSAPGITAVAYSGDASRIATGSADAGLKLFDLARRGADDAGDDDGQGGAGGAGGADGAGGAGGAAGGRGESASQAGASSGVGSGSGAASSSGRGPTVVPLAGHAGPVTDAAFSNDDQLLLSVGADGEARLWSVELAKCGPGGSPATALARYRCGGLPLASAAWAPEGAPLWFATAGSDGAARLWSTERASPVRVLAGHAGALTHVAWHPNCSLLATASRDRTARLWDLRSGEAVRVLAGARAAAPLSLAVSPDGRALAGGDARGGLAVWDLGSGRLAARADAGHAGPVWSLAYARGPHEPAPLLASGGADGTLRLWDASITDAQGQPSYGAALPELACFRTKATPVVRVAFSETNLLLAGGPLTLGKRIA